MNPILFAADTGEVYHRLTRLQSLVEWWHWFAVAGALALIVFYVGWLYRRDSRDMPLGISLVLMFLRLTAFLGILFFFLGLEKGSEQKVVRNSRVLMLFDTSLSMGLPASYEADESASRSEQVVSAIADGAMIEPLRQEHDVAVYRFDQEAKPEEVAVFPRYGELQDDETLETEAEATQRRFAEARRTAMVATGLLVVAVLSIGVFLMMGARAGDADQSSWALLTGVVALIAAAVVFGVANLRCPEAPLLAVAGLQPLTIEEDEEETVTTVEDPVVDWPEALAPRGAETRVGEAVRFLAEKERGGPAAGIVVFTDGRSNAGVNYDAAVAAAQDAGLPIFTIGFGDATRPRNVRVADLEAPERVQPGDDFSLKGYLQAFGLAGRTVEVQLTTKPSGDKNAALTIVGSERVQLGEDGQSVPVDFTATPKEVGGWVYELRVIAPSDDRIANDDVVSSTVEVIDQKTKVLLIAGGPMREYRFLRDALYRDDEVISDVLLQGGKPGISQESDEILFEFPTVAAELFEYDCIVAFDPDWMQLDELQIDLLKRWVSEKAGGLVIVAGPVFTPEWTRLQRSVDRRVGTIRELYPVTFLTQSAVSVGKVNSDQPWPLDFTRVGRESRFLWLEEDALRSEEAWTEFAGVYGYTAVKDVKQGAQVYAHFSDPSEASLNNEQPVYMVSQYYGAGRVFFMASGEMWRIREVDPKYFEQFYLRLIRWTSAGRLNRDSTRGVLLVDNERVYLRDQVAVTAILSDAQFQPLTAEEVPARLLLPDGRERDLTLQQAKDAARQGTYVGYFAPTKVGSHRIEVKEPGGEGLLIREVEAVLPTLETNDSTRNDVAMRNMAERTSGAYFVGAAAAIDEGKSTLYRDLAPRDKITFLPGRPDMDFQQLLMTWLMGLICGALSLEWLIRRLSKLA